MASSALDVLVDCAQAIEDGDLKLVNSLLEQIWNLAAVESDEPQSIVVRYFAEALVRRVYGLHQAGANWTLELTSPSDYDYFHATVDYSVRDAINNAVMGKKRLHLIDFCISHIPVLGNLFNYLSRLSGDPLSVRVSVIIPPFLKNKIKIEKKMSEAEELSKEYEIELEVVYANSLGEVDASMLDFRRTEDEALVVYYFYKLHKLLVEVGAMERELLKLRHINPEIVIIEDQDADNNDSNFIRRLKDSFQYYFYLFRYQYPEYETENYFRQQIQNIVGCEGRDRIVRQQTLAQWQSCFLTAGFLPFPLELRQTEDKQIHENNGSLVRTEENHPMYFISAWKVKDGEDDFNPSSNNLEEQGFKPRPLLEDILQPSPEGFYLNHLAAVAEIYDMLEEVCVTYELPLALTWACRANVNEIMSDPYRKRTLFIQSSFCYRNDEWRSSWFLEKIEKYPLQEGQGIAGKALQSSDQHFHFEPNITTEHYPVGDFVFFYKDQAAVAICLQNNYNIDDVYVVEFFLPNTELRKAISLAHGIFNDLKNMKKKFVTVRVALQGLNEQGGVIPNVRPPLALPMHASSSTAPHEQESEKRISVEPLANNEKEIVKVDENNLLISSARKRKLTSKVWDEFTKNKDGDGKVWAICNYCNRKFDGSSKKGTTHLKNHLGSCKDRADKVGDQQPTCPVGRGDTKNESAIEGNSSFDQARSSMNVARLIIKHPYLLNIVEDEFFSHFLKDLQPKFKLQSQEIRSSDILRVYKEEKHKLFENFDKFSCRFNLTINVWTHDLEKNTYCYYTVQFIDENWKLKKKILAVKSLGNQLDKRIFYENFKNLLADWNFEKKVCSLTVHNSSSCFEIAEEIRKSWHCFEVSHPLSTFYISSDECICGLLGKDHLGENGGKSIDGVIRTSNACLLDILDIYNKKLSPQERRDYPLMNVKSDNNCRTCSLVLAIAAVLDPRFKFDFVEFSYNTIYGDDAASIHLRMIRKALTDIFNEYASNMYSEAFFFNDTNSSTLLNAKENTIESFHRWYNFKRNVNTETSRKSELDKFVQASRKSELDKYVQASRKSELDKYCHEPIISSKLEFDILAWWCEQASRFPILGRMVRDILAIPMSSIISGSTFNEKVMMDNSIFRGLDPQIIEAMICSRYWLEAPKEISNMEPNKRSGNIGRPLVTLENSERLSSEFDNEAPTNEDLGKEATTWTEEDVRAYLVSPFTVEELEHLRKWQNHAISGEYVGRDRIQGNALAPLLMILPHDVDLKNAQNYYIEDTVVNQYFDLLKRRYEKFQNKYLKHHSFDSSYATFLINGSKAESQLLSWVNHEDLIGVRKVFLPICLHEHWLLFCADIDDKKLLWLDSNEYSRMSNVSEKLIILRWFSEFLLPSMGHDLKGWSFDVPRDIPSQKNSVDCALFVMKYADCLTHGNYFPFTQDDMPHFRHQTFLDLYRGSIYLRRS